MKKTKIEWTDATWNPVSGCFHDCPYCYARRIADRFGGASHTTNDECGCECQWLTEATGENHVLDEPIYDPDMGNNAPYPYFFDPTFYRYRLEEPARWKKPRNIFVCSMADLFGNWVPDEWIEEVFAACERAPQHRYLFLTKNPKRYVELNAKGKLPTEDNMWYGATVTTPNTPFHYSDFHKTFISIEPILEDFHTEEMGSFPFANWVIIGAETGRRKDKVIPDKKWITDLRDHCKKRAIPVFMKDSCVKIIGEENMSREFPWEVDRA